MKTITWAKDKAEKLRNDKTRNYVGFERCIVAIENGDILAIIDNPTRDNQRMLILEIDAYAYVVPFVETEDEWFLKSVLRTENTPLCILKGENYG